MKRIYSLYAAGFALALAAGVILITPPRTVYACGGWASCQYGESVSIPSGATSCSCTDNVGCTWTKDGKTYTQKCASKGDGEFEIEEGPVN
jgi:hypothetical protein